MKYIIFICVAIVLFSCKKEKSITQEEQYSFIIGDTTKIYEKLNPTFIVLDGENNGIPTNEYDTIEIDAKKIRVSIAGEHDYSLFSGIYSLNDSIEFSIIDTAISGSSDIWFLIKKYNLGDKIYHNQKWSKSGYFNGSSRAGYSFWYWGNSTNYFALRVKTNIGYKYGWVKTSIDNLDCIKIISYGMTN